jgi:hypothetical protein
MRGEFLDFFWKATASYERVNAVYNICAKESVILTSKMNEK